METITAIDVLAGGWDYETNFDKIQLLVQQDSNVRLPAFNYDVGRIITATGLFPGDRSGRLKEPLRSDR